MTKKKYTKAEAKAQSDAIEKKFLDSKFPPKKSAAKKAAAPAKKGGMPAGLAAYMAAKKKGK